MEAVKKSSGVSMKKGGRTVIVFLSLLIVILVSGMAISLYLLTKESQLRQETESALIKTRDRNVVIEAALKETEQQITVLKGKNKDADDKINSLLEELDMEKALRDQVREENKKFKDALEAESKSKAELRQKMMAELDVIQARLDEAQSKVGTSEEKAAVLQQKVDELLKKNEEITVQLREM
jgi:chromosome segregation ATPase